VAKIKDDALIFRLLVGEVASQVLERMVLGVLWTGVGGVVAQQVQGDRQQLLHHAVVRYQRAQARVLLQEPLHIENNQELRQFSLFRSTFSFRLAHRLNMEVDLQKLIWAPCAQLYSFAETPQLPPIPPHWDSYTRALLVSQDRRHLFVTPWTSRSDSSMILNKNVTKAIKVRHMKYYYIRSQHSSSRTKSSVKIP
jgi:hypothetical protein